MEMLIAAGAIAGAIVAIGILAKKAYHVLHEFFSLQAVAARLISAEMQPNGGSTLLDKVNKISTNHEEAEQHWTALQDSHARLRSAFQDAHRDLLHRLEKIEHTIATPKEVP